MMDAREVLKLFSIEETEGGSIRLKIGEERWTLCSVEHAKPGRLRALRKLEKARAIALASPDHEGGRRE